MKKKSKKDKRLYMRIDSKKHKALKDYCLEKNVTVTKIIDDFLSKLLEDRL